MAVVGRSNTTRKSSPRVLTSRPPNRSISRADVLGQIATVADANELVVVPVHHEGRLRDRRQQIANVLIEPQRRQRTHLTGARRHALVLRERLLLALVARERRGKELDRPAVSPVGHDDLDDLLGGLVAHPERVVRRTFPPRIGAIEHEMGDAITMVDRGPNARGPAVELPDDRGALHPGPRPSPRSGRTRTGRRSPSHRPAFGPTLRNHERRRRSPLRTWRCGEATASGSESPIGARRGTPGPAR